MLVFAAAVLANVVAPKGCVSSAGGRICIARGRLPAVVESQTKGGVDPLLSRTVSVLARRGAAVRCWTGAEWKARAAEWAKRWPDQGPLGPWRAYTSYDPYLAVDLSPNICAELRALVERKGRVRSDPAPDALAWAVAAVAHESVHVSGIADEAEAECYGMQLIPAAAVRLGRTRAEGRYLATLYWKHWYPWNRPPYRSRECRNGGALDLRPATAFWP